MRNFRIILVTVSISLMCEACTSWVDIHENIALVNMSDKVIGCQLLCDKNIASADSVYFAKSESHIVYPESVLMFRAQNGNWEDDIKSISYVQLLIMNGDSLQKYLNATEDFVRKHVPVLKVYRYKREDLERMNWTVIYSPR